MLFRKIPTEDELNGNNYKVNGQILKVVDKLNELPIVIIIKGVESSTFSLLVQPIHQSQDIINSIVLSEDLEFKTKISPNGYEVFEINPINTAIYFKYKSSGPVHACALN
jgi:hypothetical protein